MTTPEVIHAIETATGRQARRSGDGWKARCPAHDDRVESLSVRPGDRLTLLKCHAGCSYEAVLAAAGLRKADLYYEPRHTGGGNGHGPKTTRHKPERVEATYDYVNRDGALVYQAVRYVPKDFRQRRPDGEGGWIWNLQGVERVLYRLPDVLEQIAEGRPVYIVEGEKDVASLEAIGLTATCNCGGAGKWLPEHSETLRDARVVVLPDADAPGRKHAKLVAQSLQGIAASVRVLELPGLGPKQDATDWLASGGTPERLQELVSACPEWTPCEPATAAPTLDEGPDPLSELASAYRLRARHGENIRHVSGLGWLVWDGARWARSEKHVARLAHELGRVVRLEARDVVDPDLARRYFSHARHLETDRGVQSVLALARSIEGIDGDGAEWDSHPWLLNCLNGTLDLRTGARREHRREDRITKLCPVAYRPDAPAPRWRRFLDEVFEGDGGLVDYLQAVLGYSATGSTDWDSLYVCHGSGANGKSTLINTVQSVLGPDYAQQLDPEELMQQRNTRHSTELATLRGARFVATVETASGRRLNEALVKALTGGDRIRARFMHQDSFEFAPELKLWMGTNHRPVIRDDSQGMWRRIRLIPFLATFDGDRADRALRTALEAEREGILAWLVAGAARAAQGEPALPDRVKAATENYQHEQDTLAQFIEECCETWPNATAEKGAVYRTYREWTGGRCESQRAFSKRMQDRGYAETRIQHGSRAWRGISLRQSDLQKFEAKAGDVR